jgi:hypothetical protein
MRGMMGRARRMRMRRRGMRGRARRRRMKMRLVREGEEGWEEPEESIWVDAG